MLKVRLFRSLLRLGKNFDRNPQYKAFVYTHLAKFSKVDDVDKRVIKLVNEKDKVLSEIVSNFCSSGTYYKPTVSVAQTVRDAFRSNSCVSLATNDQHSLGYTAVRFLSNCQRFGLVISSGPERIHSSISTSSSVVQPSDEERSSEIKTMPTVSSGSSANYCVGVDPPAVTLAERIAPGTLLLSHPMVITAPLDNAVILITRSADDYHSGMILNLAHIEKFKNQLNKATRVRKGYFLRHLYDCDCFVGGDFGGSYDEMSPHFAVLHQKEELAHISEKIILPRAASAKIIVDNISDAECGADEPNFVYITRKLREVSSAVKKGLVTTADIKVELGPFMLTVKFF
jgi:hypothetical protein